jgi:hypothetical protein
MRNKRAGVNFSLRAYRGALLEVRGQTATAERVAVLPQSRHNNHHKPCPGGHSRCPPCTRQKLGLTTNWPCPAPAHNGPKIRRPPGRASVHLHLLVASWCREQLRVFSYPFLPSFPVPPTQTCLHPLDHRNIRGRGACIIEQMTERSKLRVPPASPGRRGPHSPGTQFTSLSWTLQSLTGGGKLIVFAV